MPVMSPGYQVPGHSGDRSIGFEPTVVPNVCGVGVSGNPDHLTRFSNQQTSDDQGGFHTQFVVTSDDIPSNILQLTQDEVETTRFVKERSLGLLAHVLRFGGWTPLAPTTTIFETEVVGARIVLQGSHFDSEELEDAGSTAPLFGFVSDLRKGWRSFLVAYDYQVR